jgi:hypothetical protein
LARISSSSSLCAASIAPIVRHRAHRRVWSEGALVYFISTPTQRPSPNRGACSGRLHTFVNGVGRSHARPSQSPTTLAHFPTSKDFQNAQIRRERSPLPDDAGHPPA